MHRQTAAEELDHFYRRIGAALWHIQYLEDVLVSFLVAVQVDQRRLSGNTTTETDAEALLARKCRVTLGPLIQECIDQKIIPPSLEGRFEVFKEPRQGNLWVIGGSAGVE